MASLRRENNLKYKRSYSVSNVFQNSVVVLVAINWYNDNKKRTEKLELKKDPQRKTKNDSRKKHEINQTR